MVSSSVPASGACAHARVASNRPGTTRLRARERIRNRRGDMCIVCRGWWVPHSCLNIITPAGELGGHGESLNVNSGPTARELLQCRAGHQRRDRGGQSRQYARRPARGNRRASRRRRLIPVRSRKTAWALTWPWCQQNPSGTHLHKHHWCLSRPSATARQRETAEGRHKLLACRWFPRYGRTGNATAGIS